MAIFAFFFRQKVGSFSSVMCPSVEQCIDSLFFAVLADRSMPATECLVPVELREGQHPVASVAFL